MDYLEKAREITETTVIELFNDLPQKVASTIDAAMLDALGLERDSFNNQIKLKSTGLAVDAVRAAASEYIKTQLQKMDWSQFDTILHKLIEPEIKRVIRDEIRDELESIVFDNLQEVVQEISRAQIQEVVKYKLSVLRFKKREEEEEESA